MKYMRRRYHIAAQTTALFVDIEFAEAGIGYPHLRAVRGQHQNGNKLMAEKAATLQVGSAHKAITRIHDKVVVRAPTRAARKLTLWNSHNRVAMDGRHGS